MGPRSIERGNRSVVIRIEYSESASMGPRSIERGNVTRLRVATRRF